MKSKQMSVADALRVAREVSPSPENHSAGSAVADALIVLAREWFRVNCAENPNAIKASEEAYTAARLADCAESLLLIIQGESGAGDVAFSEDMSYIRAKRILRDYKTTHPETKQTCGICNGSGFVEIVPGQVHACNCKRTTQN